MKRRQEKKADEKNERRTAEAKEKKETPITPVHPPLRAIPKTPTLKTEKNDACPMYVPKRCCNFFPLRRVSFIRFFEVETLVHAAGGAMSWLRCHQKKSNERHRGEKKKKKL
jgi:hypothetical protein